MKNKPIKRIAFTAIFSAITVILYIYLKIEGGLIPIFPGFLDINFSMIPVIICAFMLGPIDASACVVLRCLFKWLLQGTKTGYVGELADVIIGLGACIPAGIIYNYTKLKHKTLLAFISVVLGWVLFAVVSNAFITIPLYNNLYAHAEAGDYTALASWCDPAINLITFGNAHVTADNFMAYYLLFACAPFNLMLSLIVVVITLPVHKRLRSLYEMIGNIEDTSEENEN